MEQIIESHPRHKAKDIDGCYRILANEIVIQAIVDYEKALLDMEKWLEINRDGMGYEYAVWRKTECEQFFRSDYCFILCGVDGNRIIHHAKERVKQPGYDPKKRLRPFSNYNNS